MIGTQVGHYGDGDAARVEYRRFLELWADADQDMPELAEARAAGRYPGTSEKQSTPK